MRRCLYGLFAVAMLAAAADIKINLDKEQVGKAAGDFRADGGHLAGGTGRQG